MKCMNCGRKKAVIMRLMRSNAGDDVLSGFDLVFGEIAVFMRPDFIVFCTFVLEKYFL